MPKGSSDADTMANRQGLWDLAEAVWESVGPDGTLRKSATHTLAQLHQMAKDVMGEED